MVDYIAGTKHNPMGGLLKDLGYRNDQIQRL